MSKLEYRNILFLILFLVINHNVVAASRDSVSFKPSFYATTRPITDALLSPNIQVGFRTSDFNNASRNQYLQAGFTFGNYAILSSRRDVYYSSSSMLKKHYSAELDYRFLFRSNKFWSPHLQVSYMVYNPERYFDLSPVNGILYEIGFQNGKFYHKPNKNMINTIYWGLGFMQHSLRSLDGHGTYQYSGMMIYLNWQFGFKSMK